MTKSQIIEKFHLFMDDMMSLSTQEESDLFDKIYRQVCSDRPWEFTKKSYSGTMSTTLPYVDLPSDFAYLLQNANYTENNVTAFRPVVFVGSAYTPFEVVSWSDRRQYLNRNGFAYIDIVNSRLYFTLQPVSADSIEFDYHAVMPDLDDAESPAFPTRFHDIIYHGMCVEDFIIEQSDKAKSYAGENGSLYQKYLQDMAFWNANLIQI